MPFSATNTTTQEEWNRIYTDLFVPAWKEVYYDCERISIARGSITRAIIELLWSADVVFADLTDTNPNVMYELGVRHTFQKPSMMVRRKNSEMPFDVKDYVIYDYENSPTGLKELRENIKKYVKDVEMNPERSDNPVWDFLHYGKYMMNYLVTTEAKPKLVSLHEEISMNISGIVSTRKKMLEDGRLKPQHGMLLGALWGTLRIDCLAHLITTRYTSFEQTDWDQLVGLYQQLRVFSMLSSYTLTKLPPPSDIIHNQEIGTPEDLKPIFLQLDELAKSCIITLDIIDKKIKELAS